MAETNSKSIGEKLQSLPKGLLYLLLVLVTTIPLFFPVTLPNKPLDPSIDLFMTLNTLPEGSTVLVSSDWTNSTRGESAGGMDMLLRVLMRRKVKFVIFSIADPQAPQVAQNEIDAINAEREKNGEKKYERWNDYVMAGYFPNGEGFANAVVISVKEALSGRKDVNANGELQDIFQSPVMAKMQKLTDSPLFIDVTASNTSVTYVARLGGKTKLAYFVTGVMGPETFPYYSSGQLVGFASGIKGIYDLEGLMETGVNVPDGQGQKVSSSKSSDPVPGYPGAMNKGKGTLYYPALHFALFLLIIAVITGNVGMILAKRKAS